MSEINIYEDSIAYINDEGLTHRDNGPAIIYFDGNKEWYINGKFIYANYVYRSKHQFNINPFLNKYEAPHIQKYWNSK